VLGRILLVMSSSSSPPPPKRHCSGNTDASVATDSTTPTPTASSSSSSSSSLPSTVQWTSAAREEAAGILRYLGSSPGFVGVLKKRYSDFLVNEIDLNGEVVRLRNTTTSADDADAAADAAAGIDATAAAANSAEVQARAELVQLIGESGVADFEAFLRDTPLRDRRTARHILAAAATDSEVASSMTTAKERRTAIHRLLKDVGRQAAAFYSQTDKDGNIAVHFQQNKKDQRFSSWPVHRYVDRQAGRH
jgi:hypothetical protein